METKNLLVEKSEHYAVVTINRPEKLNALNAATVTELYQVMKELQKDEAMRAVIITGSGEKAFVAGADIAEIAKHDEISGKIFAMRGQKVFRFIEKMRLPVIAAINGYALGGGCELAMACHLRIASSKAKFGQPEINLGLIPGYGGTQRLPRLIGRTQAMYLLLTGEMIDARKALEIGLVNEVVEPEKLMDRARELAKTLTEKAPIAVNYILDVVDQGLNLNLDMALNLEAEMFGNICATEDMKEGTAAFLEKRKPQFKGK
ncbi:MAG: enoyl-CoA hydratase [Calditrichaeota bacterium]|nr:enoyl-CoA hydratase [Calditrichota bacterium]